MTEGTRAGVQICPDPIFVVGCPRSGTSVLSHAIAAHSGNWLGPESDFMASLIKGAKESHEIGTRRGEHHWLSGREVSFGEFLEYIGIGINALYTNRAGGLRWVEQTPQYTRRLPDLARMFPGMRAVHIVRSGRHVVHSMIHSGFDAAWATDFERACTTWVRFVESGREFVGEQPDRAIEVRNEALRASPQVELERIARFLGLELEESMAGMLGGDRKFNSSFKQKRSSWEESWTDEQRATFDRICGGLMADLGYEADGEPSGSK